MCHRVTQLFPAWKLLPPASMVWARESESADRSGRGPVLDNLRRAVGWGQWRPELRPEDSVVRGLRGEVEEIGWTLSKDEAVPVHLCKTRTLKRITSYSCLRTTTPVFSKPVQTICPALQGPRSHRALPSFRSFPNQPSFPQHRSLMEAGGSCGKSCAEEGCSLMSGSPATPQIPQGPRNL